MVIRRKCMSLCWNHLMICRAPKWTLENILENLLKISKWLWLFVSSTSLDDEVNQHKTHRFRPSQSSPPSPTMMTELDNTFHAAGGTTRQIHNVTKLSKMLKYWSFMPIIWNDQISTNMPSTGIEMCTIVSNKRIIVYGWWNQWPRAKY